MFDKKYHTSMNKFRNTRVYRLLIFLFSRLVPGKYFFGIEFSVRGLINFIYTSFNVYFIDPSGEQQAKSILNYSKKVNLPVFFGYFPQKYHKFIKTILKRCELLATERYLSINKIFTANELRGNKEMGNNMKKNLSYNVISDLFQYKQLLFRYPYLDYLATNGGFGELKRFKDRLNGGIFIDGGACFGESALLWENMFQPQKIICFEPDEKNFSKLKKNVKINQFTNIFSYKLGLGSKKQKVSLIGNSQTSRVTSSVQLSNIVIIVTLDDFIKTKIIKSVDLIKLDVEDYEFEAILGAKNTIAQFKPILFVSLYHSGKNFFEVPKLIKNIRPDYKFEIFKMLPLSPTSETILIAY